MEIVRSRTIPAPGEWRPTPRIALRHTPARPVENFAYVDSYSRGYMLGKHDGTLAGIIIGALAASVVAIVVGGLI